MSSDIRELNGAIAVTRFGLGVKPGEIEIAARDPRAWVLAQIRRQGADLPVGAPLPAENQMQARLALAQAPPGGSDQGAGAAMGPVAGTMRPLSMQANDMEGSGGGATLYQNAVMTFAPGSALPTMQAAYRTFTDYRQEAQRTKGDKDARKEAAAPIAAEVQEEIFARVRLASDTNAGFRERWALFWANHFTMAAKGRPEAVAAGPFEREAIRPHVFGRFEELLIASSSHPGMLLYLDQAQSVGPNSLQGQRRAGKVGLNENLGREILELHTVGADAGYTQADVTEFARALTGWSMGGPNAPEQQQGAFLFREAFHEPGSRTVMGRRYADEGGQQALRILIDLARDPHTADHLSRKIATHFVADDPPPTLVARLRETFLRTQGDLGQVAETLATAPEAWDPAPRKFKTPYEYLVSGYRAAGVLPVKPGKEIIQPLTALGMRPFSAPQPNGWSELASDWAAPDAIVKRLTWAQAFAAVYTPDAPPADEARAVLGQRLSQKTLTAVSRAETRPEAFAILLMSPEFQRR